ncbi:MAG: hypothetical protein PVG66_06205 [Chromatiales bacterium]|jgi:chromosome segregation ATPase
MIDISRITDVEIQAELVKLRNDLSACRRKADELQASHDRLLQDNQDLSRTLMQRAKANGESTILIERLNTMRTQLRDSERARDHAEADANELRGVMQQYVEQIKSAENLADNAEVHSLQKELSMVREQAARDVEHMRAELEKLQQEAAENAKHNDDGAVELEVLRQETESLTVSLADRQSELQNSQQTCQLLEDELEDAHADIDEMRRKLEKQAEQIDALEQAAAEAESAQAVEEVEPEQPESEEIEGEIASQPALDLNQLKTANSTGKKAVSMLAGAAVVLLAMELVSLSVGKGELFSLLMSSGQVQQQAKIVSPPKQPEAPAQPEEPVGPAAAGAILR